MDDLQTNNIIMYATDADVCKTTDSLILSRHISDEIFHSQNIEQS